MCEYCSDPLMPFRRETVEESESLANVQPSPIPPSACMPVLCISQNATINGQTFFAIDWVANQLDRQIQYVNVTKTGISHSRTVGLKTFKKLFPDRAVIRGFIVDSDIEIVIQSYTLDILLKAVKIADDNQQNFVVPYAFVSTGSEVGVGLWHTYNRRYLNAEYAALKEWDTVRLAGLGFYYGDIPLDYIFHDSAAGEDFNFFEENELILHVVKGIKLRHFKTYGFVI